ncbi:MAG: nitrilase-related carbon-nitrogen hydrolase [Pirellulales bacterium]
MLAAVVQLSSDANVENNLRAAQQGLDEAISGGAKFIVLPELFTCYGDLALAASLAETIDGPLVARFCDWARTARRLAVSGDVRRTRRRSRL